MLAEGKNMNRAWGLAAIKSAYGEMYPDCHVHFVVKIAKRIEQNVFTKAQSPRDYQNSVMTTANSIKALAGSSARNVPQRNFPEDEAKRGPMDISRNRFTDSLTRRNQGRLDMTWRPNSIPDASDVIKLVPFILEAGVQVLGKIDKAEQVRAIGDEKKSTIGFLAFEMLSKSTARSEKGISAPSSSAHRSVGRSSAPLFGCPLNDCITVASIHKPPRILTAQPKAETCLLNCPAVGRSMRELREIHGFDNSGVNDLRHRRPLHEEALSSQTMTFAELKAKYGEKIERLIPLIETQLMQRKSGLENTLEKRQVWDRVAFVRAAMKQENITNIDALRSVKTTTVQLLDIFGFLLNGDIRDSKVIENHLNESGASNQSFGHHALETFDDYEELGETDSETEDDDDMESGIEEEQQEHGFVAYDLEEELQQQRCDFSEHDPVEEDEQQQYLFTEGALYEDVFEEHEFAEDYRDKILVRGQQAGDALPKNDQASNEATNEPRMMTKQDGTVEERLKVLLETNNKQKTELGQESIPLAGKKDVGKEAALLQYNIQARGIEESKTEKGYASAGNEDATVPVFTPRRSLRIRGQASVAPTQANVSEQKSANYVETPRSTKETPAKTPRTRKTPRKTPRKPPRI